VLVKPTDVTVLISSTPYVCKISDYMLLKTINFYIFVKNE